MAIVVLNAAIGGCSGKQSRGDLGGAQKMAAQEAHVLRDGHRSVVPSHDLVPVDVALLEAGNVVPAVVRTVESVNSRIEEASLTGESLPRGKEACLVLQADAGRSDRSSAG